MNEHLESSDHAVLALFQQQVALLHLGRHQLTIEVTLHDTAAQDISNKPLPDEASHVAQHAPRPVLLMVTLLIAQALASRPNHHRSKV